MAFFWKAILVFRLFLSLLQKIGLSDSTNNQTEITVHKTLQELKLRMHQNLTTERLPGLFVYLLRRLRPRTGSLEATPDAEVVVGGNAVVATALKEILFLVFIGNIYKYFRIHHCYEIIAYIFE